jgi:hypothetical protein
MIVATLSRLVAGPFQPVFCLQIKDTVHFISERVEGTGDEVVVILVPEGVHPDEAPCAVMRYFRVGGWVLVSGGPEWPFFDCWCDASACEW